MAYQKYSRRSSYKRFVPYRRRGHLQGLRRAGYKGRGYASRPRTTGPGANRTKTYHRTPVARRRSSVKGVKPRVSKFSRNRISAASASALASTGVWKYLGFTERVTAPIGTQGWLSPSCFPFINNLSDVLPTIAVAIARTLAGTTVATPVTEPRFWIKKAQLEVTCVNVSQIDCVVTVYPWISRYDYTPFTDLYNSVLELEAKAASTTVVNSADTIGFTPFQAREICEVVRLGRPRRIRLQGGQSYTFRMSDNRTLYWNFARFQMNLAGGGGGADVNGSVRGRTRGMFLTSRGIPVNDTMNVDEITFSQTTIDVHVIKTYEWVASPQPYRFSDVVTNSADVSAYSIIQPQTGAITVVPNVV